MAKVEIRNKHGKVVKIPAGPNGSVYLFEGEEVLSNPEGLSIHYSKALQELKT